MGQLLIAFGDALDRSERPADLVGDDRIAYDEVIHRQSDAFAARGEAVWTDLLRQRGREAADETWIRETQAALWQRLGARFHFRPEIDFPLVTADPPAADPDEPDRAPKGGQP